MTFDNAHKLIKKGDLLSLRAELDSGMNPDVSNQFSWTLLMLAALEGSARIAELLIARGANINTANVVGETALSLAACGGHIRLVKLLLARGASKDCRPHGTTLNDWMRASSGLSQEKLRSVLDLIDDDRLAGT